MSDNDILKRALSEVAKVTKAKGFSKKEKTFLRKHDKTDQVINFQMNSAGVGFYLNVGLIFDELGLMDSAIGEYFGGALVQYSFRVKDGIAGTWTPGADASLLAYRIVAALTPTCTRLDAIDSAASMLKVEPLNNGFEKLLRAQLKYVTSDLEGARTDVGLVVAEFPDRKFNGKAPTLKSLAELYGMPRLNK